MLPFRIFLQVNMRFYQRSVKITESETCGHWTAGSALCAFRDSLPDSNWFLLQ